MGQSDQERRDKHQLKTPHRIPLFLGIAEGIETALAASYRFGVPVWSAILESWEPPTGVKRMIVFGDNDENCAA